MFRIIWNAFLLGVIALAAAWLSNNAGTVRMEWIGYQIDTSVAVVVGVLVLLYFVFHYCLVRPVSMLFDLFSGWFRSDARAERMAKSKVAREMDKYMLLARGMTALAAGDVSAAQKMQKQISKKFAGDESRTAVFEAQLAEAKNDTAAALKMYSELAADPETKLLGLRGKIRLYRMNGNIAQALDVCALLLKEKNPPAWVISEAFELQIQEKQWAEAIATLEKGRKMEVFSKASFRRLKAGVLLEQAGYEEDPELKEKLIRDAEDTDDTLAQAVLLTAQYNAQKGQVRKARAQLKELWKKAPGWAVYEAYAGMLPDASPIDVVKDVEEMIRENPDEPLNDLILADCSLKAQLWGQAKMSLEKYLKTSPNSRRALMLMADVAEHNRDERTADMYREKAAAAAAEAPFKCTVCLTDFNEGHIICPVCHTFGTTMAN